MNAAPHRAKPAFLSIILSSGIACGQVGAGEPAPPVATQHQMMKECMAKQKASDAGLPKEQMKKRCRDIIQTERENAKADRDSTVQAGTARP